MSPSAGRDNRQADQSPSSITRASTIRSDLLDRLAKTLVDLDTAKRLLRNAIEKGDAARYQGAYFEIERLHTDYRKIRIELEWHQTNIDQRDQFE